MTKHKFKKGDVVIVVALDEGMANEEYDCLGEYYKATLYKVGTVVDVQPHRENKYTVHFPQLRPTVNTWYLNEKEIIHYDNNINMNNVKLLYEKKV